MRDEGFKEEELKKRYLKDKLTLRSEWKVKKKRSCWGNRLKTGCLKQSWWYEQGRNQVHEEYSFSSYLSTEIVVKYLCKRGRKLLNYV